MFIIHNADTGCYWTGKNWTNIKGKAKQYRSNKVALQVMFRIRGANDCEVDRVSNTVKQVRKTYA